VTDSTSSAIPQQLLSFAQRARSAVDEIRAEEHALETRLLHFKSACAEPDFCVQVDDLLSRNDSGNANLEALAMFVQGVAQDFLAADGIWTGPQSASIQPHFIVPPAPPGLIERFFFWLRSVPQWLNDRLESFFVEIHIWLEKHAQTQAGGTASLPTAAPDEPPQIKHPIISTVGGAETHHVNQFLAEVEYREAYDRSEDDLEGSNADCGPASLLIGLHVLGLAVLGEGPDTRIGEQLFLARKAMVNDAARDGVDEQGGWQDSEHSKYTTLNEIENGATRSGAITTKIEATPEAVEEAKNNGGTELDATIAAIRQAILNGSVVVVTGTFVGKDPLPWEDDRSGKTGAPGGAKEHIIVVTGYDPQSNNFIINDPSMGHASSVTPEQLADFMRGKESEKPRALSSD
jgi:hypothetical protein